MWFNKVISHSVYLRSNDFNQSVPAVILMVSSIATAKVKRNGTVTELKGETFHTTSKMLRDNGYKIYIIDFRYRELFHRINILESIINYI